MNKIFSFIILSLYVFFLPQKPKNSGFGPGLILLYRILIGIFIAGLIVAGLAIFGVIKWIH